MPPDLMPKFPQWTYRILNGDAELDLDLEYEPVFVKEIDEASESAIVVSPLQTPERVGFERLATTRKKLAEKWAALRTKNRRRCCVEDSAPPVKKEASE